MLDEIVGGLRVDGKVTLTGIGTFEVKARKERKGRNPQTGEVITIPAGKRVVFRTGSRLKNL